MTKYDDVTFPATFAELKAMGSPELRVLVGKLPTASLIHPQLTSYGYHMTKAERITFIGHHFYGVSNPEGAAAALAAGQAKYDTLKAKKGAGTGPKIGSGSTNCTATAAKALGELATEVPPVTKLLADIGSGYPTLGPPGSAGYSSAVAKWLSTADDLGDEPAVKDFLSKWSTFAKATEQAADEPGSVSDYGLWLSARQLADAHKALPNDVPGILGDASKVISQARSSSIAKVSGITDMLTSGDVDQIRNALYALSGDTFQTLAPDLVPSVGLDIVNKLAPAIDQLVDGSTIDTLAALDGIASDYLSPTFLGGKIKFTPDQAEAVADVLSGAIAKLDTSTALAADQFFEASAAAASSATYSEALGVYAQMSKSELKAIGPTKFEAAGVDTPSLAHWLPKDELADALAKIDSGQDISDLLVLAEQKKATSKAKSKAKAAVLKDPDAPIPAAKAATETVDTVADVDQAVAKAVATKLPETPADVEALSVPELGPPEVPPAPAPKYPKPAQTSHTWTIKGKQDKLGGAHTKAQYEDEDGAVWMWKKSETKGVADGEVLAHEIGWDLGLDMADIRYAEGWTIPRHGRFPHGTIQKFHQGVRGDMRVVGIGDMTPAQLGELQDHQVFDWLISQHDTHTENILIMADGHLAPIDKGQAFKFFGADRLEVGYIPPGNFGRPVYYDLWDRFAAGTVDLDLDHIDTILARIESLSDEEYRAKIAAYVRQRFTDGGRGVTFLPEHLRSESALIDAVVKRKQDIRAQFTAFYKEQARRRGIDWTPAWERRLADATPEVVQELGAPAVAAGITTPLNESFAKAVTGNGSAGKAIHLGGKDVNAGQALVWTEQAKDGSRILRMELRLEADAERRVTKLLRGITDDTKLLGASGPTVATNVDTAWGNVLAMAKTVGAHQGDGAYNTSTVQAARKAVANLRAAEAATKADVAKALAAGDAEEWATAMAKLDMADHYEAAIKVLDDAMVAKTSSASTIVQFDYDATKAKYLSEFPGTPATATAEPAQTLFKSLEVGKDRYYRTEATDDIYGYRRTGAEDDIRLVSHGSSQSGWEGVESSSIVGRQFTGTMDVGGSSVRVGYRGYDMTRSPSRKGLMDLELEGWGGSEQDIERLMVVLDRLGVETHLATAEDEALLYWRTIAGSWKHTVEYNTGIGSGPYGKIRSTIDAIEDRVAKAGNLTPSQEAAIHRDAWTEVFGADATARAPEKLIHARDARGVEVSYGDVLRFDLPEDMRPMWSRQGGWIHGSNHVGNAQMSSFAGAPTTQDLVRTGVADLRGGATTSAADDLHSGGAAGTFAAPGWSRYANGRDFYIGRPASIDRRVTTYSYAGDKFGSIGKRAQHTYLDPSQGIRRGIDGGEAVVRNGMFFGDDVEVLVVRNQARRNAILADLRKQGVTEIRGRPIEERVLYHPARDDAGARALVARISEERQQSMFHPYADWDEVVGGSPSPVPAKPAPKKVRVKKAKPVEPDVPLASAAPPEPAWTPVAAAPPSVPAGSPSVVKLQAALDTASPSGDATTTLAAALKSADVADPDGLAEALASASLVDPDLPPTLADTVKLAKEYLASVDSVAHLPPLEAVQVVAAAPGKASIFHLTKMAGFDTLAEADEAFSEAFANGETVWKVWIKKQAEAKAATAPVAQVAEQVSETKSWITAQLGDTVDPSQVDKVFNYSVPGAGKVKVQFIDADGQPKIIAEHPAKGWVVINNYAPAKTPKDEVLKLLKAAGWPGMT